MSICNIATLECPCSIDSIVACMAVAAVTSLTSLSQFHDQRNVRVFHQKQPLVSEDAGGFAHAQPPPPLFFCALTLLQEWLYIATCMSAYIMGPCYIVLMLHAPNPLNFARLASDRRSPSPPLSCMFIFGLNNCRLFAFVFFGWKLNAVLRFGGLNSTPPLHIYFATTVASHAPRFPHTFAAITLLRYGVRMQAPISGASSVLMGPTPWSTF